jgi:hypothetical protein
VPRDQLDSPVGRAVVLIEENPLARYRRLQRRLRQAFEPFTRTVCPACPTPCCRRPAAVSPFDVVLAEELDYRLPAGTEAAHDAVAAHLGLIPIPTLAAEGEPCAFLGTGGCSFPPDLMPFGCVAFVCHFMEEWYPAEKLTEIRAAIAELETAYRTLRAALVDGE